MNSSELRRAIELSGISIAQLARDSDVLPTTLYSFMSGQTRSLRVDTAEKVIAGLAARDAMSGVREESTEISGQVTTQHICQTSKESLQVSLPSGLLEAAREYELDAEALVLEGGRDKLEAEVRREFSERNAEAIEWSRKHIAEHGTFGQRFGVFRY
tara:strand:- start:992 stop:1462 length:471 start_codon:yes stop_codon:yes gene_type:complete